MGNKGVPSGALGKNLPAMQETHWRGIRCVGHGEPLQCMCLGNCMNQGAWWPTVHGSQGVRRD